MPAHSSSKGYKATVYNRSKDKAEAAARRRGRAGPIRPQQLAEQSDVVFAIVGFPKDVREVFLGSRGRLAGSKPGTIADRHDHQRADAGQGDLRRRQGQGRAQLDAPVSGGDVGAKNAALSIMVGGDADVIEAVKPLLECMGKTIVHQGGAGAGQHTKMVNQILIAGNMVGVCEALLYAYKAGLDPKTVLQSVGGGAAASWSLNNLGPRIIDRNFEPGFFVEHFIKDMGIALEESRRLGLVLPGLALANQLYLAVQAPGPGPRGHPCPGAGVGRHVGPRLAQPPAERTNVTLSSGAGFGGSVVRIYLPIALVAASLLWPRPCPAAWETAGDWTVSADDAHCRPYRRRGGRVECRAPARPIVVGLHPHRHAPRQAVDRLGQTALRRRRSKAAVGRQRAAAGRRSDNRGSAGLPPRLAHRSHQRLDTRRRRGFRLAGVPGRRFAQGGLVRRQISRLRRADAGNPARGSGCDHRFGVGAEAADVRFSDLKLQSPWAQPDHYTARPRRRWKTCWPTSGRAA